MVEWGAHGAWKATASWDRGGVQWPHTSPPKGQGPRRASLISEVPLVNGTQGDWGWGIAGVLPPNPINHPRMHVSMHAWFECCKVPLCKIQVKCSLKQLN